MTSKTLIAALALLLSATSASLALTYQRHGIRHHRVYSYSPQTSAPMVPGGSAYGQIYGGYGGEPYSRERWGGFGPDGDYGPGRP
jgi:hypothetical protein